MAYGFELRHWILLIFLLVHGLYGLRLAGPGPKWRFLGLIMGSLLGPLGLFFFAVYMLRSGPGLTSRLPRGWVLHRPGEFALPGQRHFVHGNYSGNDGDE